MTEKQIFSRILHKYDTEANWNRATTFVPKKGELIIYSDRSSFKVGDGETLLSNLKFFDKKLEDLIHELVEDVTMDWNASEGEQGHIENRTHYIGEELAYVLSPTYVTYDSTYASYTVLKSVYLVIGEEYTVTWRGQQYQVIAQDVSSWGGSGAIGLGNCSSIGGIFSPVPFGMVSYNGIIDCWPQDGKSDPFELSIQTKTLIYHKLSKDFLPDDVVYIAVLNGIVDSKVDKVSGKGLSTNDYTDIEKTKLNGIASGAQVNVIESVKVNNSALSVNDKSVNIDLSSYATKSYADQAEADALSAAKNYASGLASNYATAAQGAKADSAVQPADLPTALKNPNALSVGSKIYDGSSAITIEAADLGLSNALHFIGVKSSLPTTGSYVAGDVILVGNKEYVYNNGWIELGDGDSHALKTISITAGSGLTGGGTLSADFTISHADTSSQASISANGRKYITGVTLDTYGHVTGLTTGTETVTDTNTTYTFAPTKNSSNGNVKLNLTAGGSGSGTQSATIKGSGATTVTTDANGVITISSTDNNTQYTGNAGITLDGTTFKHSNSITAKTTYIQGATLAPGYAGTFTVYEPKYDAQGHITGVQGTVVTMPSAQTIPTLSGGTSTTNDAKVIGSVTVNGHAITAGTKTIKAGSNISVTGGTSEITIAGNYGNASTTAAGLMSAADKEKLDGIAAGANKYTLPTASSTLGGVKTTSTVTSTSGLTACPIISGVPYYKDTTYSLSSFNITATATELNYTDGVTSNIQNQLNARLTKILVEGEDYGTTLPTTGTKGRVFFKTVS